MELFGIVSGGIHVETKKVSDSDVVGSNQLFLSLSIFFLLLCIKIKLLLLRVKIKQKKSYKKKLKF